MLKISQVGIDLIKKFEGCSLRAYKPVKSETHFTIGYGHYGPDVKEGEVITQGRAEELLKSDLKRFEDGVNKLVTVELNQHQFDALVSFAFNLGLGNLSASTLLKCVNNKDFTNAANEFEKWVKAGGVVLAGLVTRRKAEKELFAKMEPKPKESTSFPAAQEWVMENKISDGSKPKESVTREQVWEMLRRALANK